MMDKRIVIDIETQRTFDEVGGRAKLDQLGVSVVGVYHYATDTYECFEEKDLGQLQNVLIDSNLIIGFNHAGFDLPVLQAYFSIDVKTLPVFDIMVDLQARLGHRVGLDSVASATLGVGKTGNGLDAIKYFREGQMEKLKKYCLNDVKVTREVFDFGIKNNRVFFTSKFGQQKKELAVDWKSFKKPAVAAQAAPAQYKLF